MGQPDRQEVLALLDLPVQPELLVQPGPRDQLVLRGLPAPQAQPDRRVLLARQDPREPTVQQVRRDPPGLPELQALPVQRELRVILDPRDLPDLPDLLGLQERADPQDQRAVRQQ